MSDEFDGAEAGTTDETDGDADVSQTDEGDGKIPDEVDATDPPEPAAVYEAVREAAGRVLIGNEPVIEGLTIALLIRGHVLIEGVPGVAKTTAANLFARASGLEYNRIQMTPDILPADVTGTYVYRETTGEFELRTGPVFANVVVADEINRATPKTQSALLEAMQERAVTIEGETLPLPEPFLVVATQNPIEYEGSLHPEETIYLNGGLRTAGDALASAREDGTLIYETDDTRIYDADLRTQTLDEDGTIRKRECYLYEKEFEGELYTVRTKTGNRISVSGNHPFLVNRDGVLQWVEARDLEESDHLVSPDTLSVESKAFPSHEETLEALAEDYRFVGEDEVRRLQNSLTAGETLSRDELDALRIARGWSKQDLAERTDDSYDRVLNYLDGAETDVGKQIRSALSSERVDPADSVESHRIHRFERSLTDAEAGFLTGFVLSDGSFQRTRLSVTQKNLDSAFDRWVELVEEVGMRVRVRDIKGGRKATVHSKPFVDYLTYRYDIDTLEQLLDAPEAFRKSFLEIFLLAESHYDAENRRISFIQKDRRTTNLIAHLLLQFDIRPWIRDRGDTFQIRIQGEDIRTYLGRFEWPGEPPDTDVFEGSQRTVPLPPDSLQRVVDILGTKYEGEMANTGWYHAFDRARRGKGSTSERLAEAFVDAMRRRVEDRRETEQRIEERAREDLGAVAKSCGLSLTDMVDGTDLTKHSVWQAYEGDPPSEGAVDYVVDTFTERVEEAERLTSYLESLLDGDVFYDPIVDIESEPYQGPVIGLSVPRTHNYVAGLGACGINHNTFELPEAQRDRFLFKLVIDLPDRTDEREILDRFDDDPTLGPDAVDAVIDPDALVAAREQVAGIHVADAVKEYVLDLVAATREHPDVAHGASPRASLAFLNVGKARAALHGREYVIPDDIKPFARQILAHRLVLSTDAELSDVTPDDVVEEVVDSVAPPGADADIGVATDGESSAPVDTDTRPSSN